MMKFASLDDSRGILKVGKRMPSLINLYILVLVVNKWGRPEDFSNFFSPHPRIIKKNLLLTARPLPFESVCMYGLVASL